jgi:hypothetical protein
MKTIKNRDFKNVCSGFVLLLLGFTLCCLMINSCINIANESIILTFIGALATFVVVGNYIQTKDVKDTTDREIDKMKKEIDTLKNSIEPTVEDALKDYHHTVEAYIHLINGITYMNKNEWHTAFNIFITAIKEINQATNKRPLEGLTSCMKKTVLEINRPNNQCLPKEDIMEGLRICSDYPPLFDLLMTIKTKEKPQKAEKSENNNAISTGNNSVNQSNIKGDNIVTKNANLPT